jgi:GNAT superfamily N-acetyltransferase
VSGEDGVFTLRPLEPGDVVNKLQLAHEDDALRAFLKQLAPKFHEADVAKTYVAVEGTDQGPRIRSYISISLSEILREYANLEDCPEASRFNYPAVKIGRLATDRRYEGRGLGGALIDLVVGLVHDQIMPHAGCRFLILDANRAKIGYYQRRGFVLVRNPENLDEANQNPVMFMDLHRLSKAAAPEADEPEPEAAGT